MACNHDLGEFGGDKIYLDDFAYEVRQAAKDQYRLYEKGYYQTFHTEKEIMDFRRGYLHPHTYCPICGEEIDWKEIKDEVINSKD